MLHDVEEMKYLMLHSAPKMLLHILPPPPVAGDYTSDASSSQEGFSSSANGNSTSNNSLPNSTIHQVDVAERQLLVSTTEPRVYLYNLDDEGRLFPVGGAKAAAAAATGSSAFSTSATTTTPTSNGHKKGKKSSHSRKTESSSSVNHCSGVTALATYRLLELTTFGNSSQQQQSSVLDEDNSSNNSSSGDFESPSNPANGFYHRPSTFQSASSRLPPPQISSAPVKAYRLVSTECTFYATRPKCRLWVVDHQGAVQFTQQYAELVKREVGVIAAAAAASGGEQQQPPKGKSFELQQQPLLPPISQENELAVPKLPLQRRKKKSADHGQTTSAPVLNFGKLYSMYWRRRTSSSGRREAEELSDSLTVNSYIVTYSTTSSTNSSSNTFQQHHPRLFVIDPNSQVILATSPPIEGAIEEVKCIGNDVFVGYRAEPTASLQLAVLTLHFTRKAFCCQMVD